LVKKRNIKRKYVKRTRKYKFLKGGLSDNDKININITDRFIFQDGCHQPGGGGDNRRRQDKINEFKKYLFGSEEHAELWEKILQLCFDRSIPFYILTSGSKIGIIRTLQLLELDDLVAEVLCNNESVVINPVTNPPVRNREDFRKMNKYQIITDIVSPNYNGIFVDNDIRNKNGSELCPNIEFIHATGITISRHTADYSTQFSSFVGILSIEYKSPIPNYTHTLYETGTNLVNTDILRGIIEKIEGEGNEIRYVFADFDGTMSPWRGALPFHHEDFNRRFFSHFNVIAQ
jgi:hypothetical protein